MTMRDDAPVFTPVKPVMNEPARATLVAAFDLLRRLLSDISADSVAKKRSLAWLDMMDTLLTEELS
jgi:hypothetical protein